MFESAVISPVGGEPVSVHAPGASFVNKYVQSADLGGDVLDRAWFTHDELFDSCDETFEMGPLANESWGADPDKAPPSMSAHDLAAFGCPERGVSEPELIATVLNYTGDTRAKSDSVVLEATLTTAEGTGVADQAVTFEIAGQTLEAVTDAAGVARSSVSIPNHGKSQQVIVRYAGNADYIASDATATITWGNKKG